MTFTLLQNPPQDQESWRFTVPGNHLSLPRRRNEKNIYGKFLKFTADAITLEISQFPSNRILRSDDPKKFLLTSFEKLRFPEGGLRVTTDYITRMMKAGVFLNGVQYRFYHHSNSQLVSGTYSPVFQPLQVNSEAGHVSCGKQTTIPNWITGYMY